MAFNSGAKQVTGGSIAIKNPELFNQWLVKYGNDRIILGADAKNEHIAISGWQEETNVHINQFLQDYIKKGIKYTICTDVSKDGMMQGPSLALYRNIIKNFPDLQLIASGGVASINDVAELKELNLFGVIIGKAIYEGNIQLKELEQFL